MWHDSQHVGDQTLIQATSTLAPHYELEGGKTISVLYSSVVCLPLLKSRPDYLRNSCLLRLLTLTAAKQSINLKASTMSCCPSVPVGRPHSSSEVHCVGSCKSCVIVEPLGSLCNKASYPSTTDETRFQSCGYIFRCAYADHNPRLPVCSEHTSRKHFWNPSVKTT